MEEIPLTVLTGFLGSGKTTLLNDLLKTPELADSAVLINEFGEIALDHHLVETMTESTVVLDSGCICCTVRGALSGALRTLFWQRHDKKIPHFKRLILETTGLANPAPILHELLSHPAILSHYRLAGVIVCVDSVFGAQQLDRHPEAAMQAAVADRFLFTKTDLVTSEQVDSLACRLREINPGADVFQGSRDSVNTRLIVDSADYDPLSKNLDVQQWLKAEAYRRVQVKPGMGLSKKALPASENSSRHSDGIQAFCLRYDRPLPYGRLMTALEMLAVLHGDQLLRLKGIVNIEGEDKPCVIHGVQRMLFPSTVLARWPSEDRDTRLVFIVRDMDIECIAQTLDDLISSARNTSQEEIVH